MTNDEILQRYFDDELDVEERARFEATMSDADRERLAALGELRGLLGNALAAEADVDIWSRVEAALPGPSTVEKKARNRRWRDWVRGRVGRTTSAGLLVAALATLLVVFRPWHPGHPTNECDVETLEVEGALATVIKVADLPHHGDGTTTIIWQEAD
jgi:anti-sigma factor RsiW